MTLLNGEVNLKIDVEQSDRNRCHLVSVAPPEAPFRLWLLSLGSRSERKFVPLEHSEFSQVHGRFSPDGRWIAYHQ